MKKLPVFLLILFVANASLAQYTLRLMVDSVGTKKGDAVYVAGGFNNWNPRDENYRLKPFGTTRKGIVLKDLPAGKYEFKFTRGAQNKWETTAKGEEIANREITLSEDASFNYFIAGWKDDFPDKPKPNTATAQVFMVDSGVKMPQLERTRSVWIYLPKGYPVSSKRYPVIYMHDGQNLFNERTAGYGEWGVDEALDTLAKMFGKEMIVVGIAHGDSKRMTEYNPYDNAKFGKGEGKQYVDFLVQTLKPFVDKKYRTLKDSSNTFVAGSSMGGLISLYAVIKYPNIFGGAGIFSPAFWVTPELYEDVSKAALGAHHKLYFYAGGAESNTMVSDMDRMLSIIQKKGIYEIRRVENPIGKHNEAAWRKEFPEFYEFIVK